MTASTDTASLTIKVDSTQTTQGAAALDKLSASATGASKSVDKLGESEDQAQARIKAMVQASMQKVQAQNASITAGQRQIQLTDAQRAALDQLNASSSTQAAMNARGAAILAAEDRARAAAAASIKAVADAEAKATVATAASTGALDANTAAMTINGGVARELGILSGELARGNFTRLEGSMITLTNRAGLMGVVFSSVGLALGAVAAIGVTVYEFFEKLQETDKELTTFQQAIALAGNRSDVSAQQLLSLADSLGKAKGNTSDYVQILAKIGTSADIPAASLGNVATQIESIAQATGQTSEQVTSEYQKILEDPGKMADDLFQKLGVLTPAEYDLVKQLQSSGQTVQAGTTLWNDYVDAVGRAPDALQKAQDALAKTQRAIATYNAAPSSFQLGAGLYGTPSVSASNDPYLANLKQQEQQQATSVAMLKAVDDAQNLLTADQRKAITTAENAGNATDKLRSKLKQLQQQYATLQTVSLDATSKNRLSANLNDEIADVQKQIAQSQKKAAGPDLDSGLPDANSLLAKSVQADIKADQQQLVQWAKNTAGLKEYQDAINGQIAARQKDYDAQLASIGLGSKEASQMQQMAQLDQQVANNIEQLTRSRSQKGANQSYIDSEIAAQKASLPVLQQQLQAFWASQDKAQGDWTNGFTTAFANFNDQAANVATASAQVFTNAFSGMTTALTNFVTTGKGGFKSFTVSVLTDLAKMEIQIAESKALTAILGAFGVGTVSGAGVNTYNSMGGISNVAFNATGGVYDSPSLSQYSGKIVNRPTPFLFASGAGIMGEAGPEAILPLKRGSDGKLGVQTGGSNGGVTVNTTVNVSSDGSATTDVNSNSAYGKQIGSLISSKMKETMLKEQRPGGILWKMAHP